MRVGRKKPRSAVKQIGRALLAVAAVLGPVHCTLEERHAWLTRVFDGVPPLHPPAAEKPVAVGKAPSAGKAAALAQAAPAVVWAEHKPTLDAKGCGACHDRRTSFDLVKPLAELCLTCHEKETKAFRRMHGPAAIGDCAACHEAHRSPYPHLLRAPAEKLCFRCHDRTAPGAKTAGCPRQSDAVGCTTCHQPHGGTDRYFLAARPKDAAEAPKAAPTPPSP